MLRLLFSILVVFFASLSEAQIARLGEPIFSGTGCPAGSASASLSPDSAQIAILFDAFSISHQANDPQAAQIRLSCKIQIPVELPYGYMMDVMKLDYRGFYAIEDKRNQFSLITTGLRVVLARGYISGAPQTTYVNGPVNSNYLITHTLPKQARSECGRPFTLEFSVDMTLQGPRMRAAHLPIVGDVMAALDSLDGGISPGAGAYVGVALQRCRPVN